jgi:hypothetical protein
LPHLKKGVKLLRPVLLLQPYENGKRQYSTKGYCCRFRMSTVDSGVERWIQVQSSGFRCRAVESGAKRWTQVQSIGLRHRAVDDLLGYEEHVVVSGGVHAEVDGVAEGGAAVLPQTAIRLRARPASCGGGEGLRRNPIVGF